MLKFSPRKQNSIEIVSMEICMQQIEKSEHNVTSWKAQEQTWVWDLRERAVFVSPSPFLRGTLQIWLKKKARFFTPQFWSFF